VFDGAGYAPVTADRLDDPDTVGEAAEHPEAFAGKSVGDVGRHRPGAVPRRAAAALSALKSGSPILGSPLDRNRAVPLTYDQFRYAFANEVSEEEARELHETFAVRAAGKPLVQAAAANLNPRTEAKVDADDPERGPLLVISGEKDHTVPHAIAHASYARCGTNRVSPSSSRSRAEATR
jgi:hypothetical protein